MANVKGQVTAHVQNIPVKRGPGRPRKDANPADQYMPADAYLKPSKGFKRFKMALALAKDDLPKDNPGWEQAAKVLLNAWAANNEG